MNRTRLLMIGFLALALGAFVSYSVYRSLQARAGGNVPGDDVVIAKGDLAVGSKILDEDVKLVHFPAGDLPPNCFHQKSRVVGRGVVLPIARGEFILPNKLAGENAGSGLPSLIPPGMRAVSVRVNEIVSVAGFVQPGTRVDVLLTGNPTGGDQQTTTVLENVLVLATGQKLERTTIADTQAAAVITLEVSPDDAQKLTLASTQGHIQLSLRNPLDTKQQDILAARSNSLYKVLDKPVPVAHAKVKRPAPTPLPSIYTVEVIRGEKKDEVKF